MRLPLVMLAATLLLTGVDARAQEPPASAIEIVPRSGYFCPDPPVRSAKPVCCKITLDVDATGKATAASAKCTNPAYEESNAQCQKGRPQDVRTSEQGATPYSKTIFIRDFPSFPTPAMMEEVDRLCTALGEPPE